MRSSIYQINLTPSNWQIAHGSLSPLFLVHFFASQFQTEQFLIRKPQFSHSLASLIFFEQTRMVLRLSSGETTFFVEYTNRYLHLMTKGLVASQVCEKKCTPPAAATISKPTTNQAMVKDLTQPENSITRLKIFFKLHTS